MWPIRIILLLLLFDAFFVSLTLAEGWIYLNSSSAHSENLMITGLSSNLECSSTEPNTGNCSNARRI